MGKAKKTRNFSLLKRMINPKDLRVHEKKGLETKPAEKTHDGELVREIPQASSSLFLEFNKALVPPYQVLVDTNFINFCIKNRIDIEQGMLDCLYAKCIPCITDCVMAELEKLGPRFRVALKIARNDRFVRLHCSHQGTYADDCLVTRVSQHKCYIVASNDKQLKQRIRKIPGVPIMYVGNHRLKVEKLMDVQD